MQGHNRKLPKVQGTQRTVTAEETFARALPIARSLGVTRIADITGLDRVGIPTWSAVVPRSDDIFSVYNGKGMRSIEAKTGALMEAIERQTALKARLPIVEGSVRELRRNHELIDPRDLREVLSPDYSETRTYAWVTGRDHCSGREVLVPAKYAGYLWMDIPHPSCHAYCSSNGIAAGNVREEAICQGLCELIERDAWTLAEIGAHVLPRVSHPRPTTWNSFRALMRKVIRRSKCWKMPACLRSCTISLRILLFRRFLPRSPTRPFLDSPWSIAAWVRIRTRGRRFGEQLPKQRNPAASTSRQCARTLNHRTPQRAC
jgi:ribosomal protein S12 methylthiotransferase accessory factor YcaO